MAQKVTGIIKLQINAAKATASPPVGPKHAHQGGFFRFRTPVHFRPLYIGKDFP